MVFVAFASWQKDTTKEGAMVGSPSKDSYSRLCSSEVLLESPKSTTMALPAAQPGRSTISCTMPRKSGLSRVSCVAVSTGGKYLVLALVLWFTKTSCKYCCG